MLATPSVEALKSRCMFEGSRYATLNGALLYLPPEGDILVCGVAQGGLLGLIAREYPTRRVVGYCRFDDGLSTPGEFDSSDLREGSCASVFEEVKDFLSCYPNVELVKGDVDDTLVIDRPVALAIIDMNLYKPTKVALERIWPKLVPNGIILIDDWDWTGVHQAILEFGQGIQDNRGYILWIWKR